MNNSIVSSRCWLVKFTILHISSKTNPTWLFYTQWLTGNVLFNILKISVITAGVTSRQKFLGWCTAWRCPLFSHMCLHYNDVIIGAMATEITSLTIVYSIVYSGADQRKQQSSASLAFVREIHRWPVNSPQRAGNAENVSIWWRHHVNLATYPVTVISVTKFNKSVTSYDVWFHS